MDGLVPNVISLILRWGAMMVLKKAGFMSLCHALEALAINEIEEAN